MKGKTVGFIFKELAYPLARRVGTFAAGGLVGFGVLTPDIALSVEGYVATGVLLAVDLAFSHYERVRRK